MDILSGLLGFHPQPHLPTVSGSTYYRLAPDTRALEIETVVTNVSEVPQAITGGDGLIPSDHFGAPYMPGAGFARKRMQGETDFIGVVGERNEGAFGLMPPPWRVVHTASARRPRHSERHGRFHRPADPLRIAAGRIVQLAPLCGRE